MPVILILVFLLALFLLETVFVEVEQWGWATALLIATAVGCHFLTPFDPLAFVKAQGPFTVVYVLGYLSIGVVWSFIKWFSFLRSFRDQFREQKENFLKSKGLPTGGNVPEEHLEEFKRYIRDSLGYGFVRSVFSGVITLERPRASANKSRITAWMAYWPCSALGTLLNDPVRRLFNFLFNQFKALYQKMSDHVFRDDVELK